MVKQEEVDALAALRQPPAQQAPTLEQPAPSSSSESSRHTVLFPDTATFTTETDFFDECRRRLRSQYGVVAVPSKNKPTQVSARCVRRKDDDCPFRICAVKGADERWALHPRSCVWEHSHPPAESTRDGPTLPVAGGGETEGLAATAVARPLSSSSSLVLTAALHSTPDIPGLPGPDAVFTSLDEAYLAYTKAWVTAWGVGVFKAAKSPTAGRLRCNRATQKCPWSVYLYAPSPGRFVVVISASNFEHNHGARPEILADPSWRPVVKNPAARRALGLSENVHVGAPARPVTHVFTNTDTTKRPAPSARLDSPPAKKPRVASFASTPHATSRAGTDFNPPVLTSNAPLPSPSVPPAPLHGSHAPSPSLSSLPPSPSPALTDLRAFLHALHPSTALLAPHLLSSGLTSPSDLASLLLLALATLELFLADVGARVAAARAREPGVGGGASVVQLKLLGVKLREARAALNST